MMGAPEPVMDEVSVYETEFFDDFQEGILSESKWAVTRQNDFRQSIIDVIGVGQDDFCLRMRADTIGTRDDTVKSHGVRTLQEIDFTDEKVISFELDWNNQANGSYLTAGLYLCPVATNTNPRDEADWVAFEYVGVPPGENARFQIARAKRGNLHFLFTEGWPDKQRTGRKIANQHLELSITKSSLKVMENGKELFITEDYGVNFTKSYLYLQMSSHSNYPPREVYFDGIFIKNASTYK